MSAPDLYERITALEWRCSQLEAALAEARGGQPEDADGCDTPAACRILGYSRSGLSKVMKRDPSIQACYSASPPLLGKRLDREDPQG